MWRKRYIVHTPNTPAPTINNTVLANAARMYLDQSVSDLRPKFQSGLPLHIYKDIAGSCFSVLIGWKIMCVMWLDGEGVRFVLKDRFFILFFKKVILFLDWRIWYSKGFDYFLWRCIETIDELLWCVHFVYGTEPIPNLWVCESVFLLILII